MSEYIMGLGISVKISKLYERLVFLALSSQNGENDEEYFECVEEIQKLIEDESLVYDKLDVLQLDKYFKEIIKEDIDRFDSVKNRYYLKLKERIALLDNDTLYKYPITLNTAILGKILLESLSKIERQFLSMQNYDNTNIIVDNPIYNLYLFHITHKYTLIASNEFLERLAVNYDFRLSKIPNVSFEKIKDDFGYDDTFYKELDNILYLIAIDTIDVLINNKNVIELQNIYSNLLYISQLEIVTSYLNKDTLERLSQYYKNINIKDCPNGKYIITALTRKRNK